MESNVQKMHEALNQISESATYAIAQDDLDCGDLRGFIEEMGEIAHNALSEPQRNCDVGTIEEQKIRFFSEHQDTTLSAEVAIDWMQQTYKGSISERNK